MWERRDNVLGKLPMLGVAASVTKSARVEWSKAGAMRLTAAGDLDDLASDKAATDIPIHRSLPLF